MADRHRGFETSSGKKRPKSLAGLLVIGILAVIAAVVIFSRSEPPAEPDPEPTPTAVVRTTAVPQRRAVVPTATTIVEYRSDSVMVSAPTYTPEPYRSAPTRAPRRPTDPPRVADCVRFSWSAHQSRAAWGQILIDIKVVNRCGRKVEPSEVPFLIVGYRDGGVVQTATGSPFRTLFPGRSEQFSIGLPGSIDWYDEITVEIRN
jgi:hypothetical protein